MSPGSTPWTLASTSNCAVDLCPVPPPTNQTLLHSSPLIEKLLATPVLPVAQPQRRPHFIHLISKSLATPTGANLNIPFISVYDAQNNWALSSSPLYHPGPSYITSCLDHCSSLLTGLCFCPCISIYCLPSTLQPKWLYQVLSHIILLPCSELSWGFSTLNDGLSKPTPLLNLPPCYSSNTTHILILAILAAWKKQPLTQNGLAGSHPSDIHSKP